VLTGRAELCERLPALASSIAPLRHALIEFARRNGGSDSDLEDIAVAVSEALTNVVVHAYVGHPRPGIVAVEARMDRDGLQIVVCDEGIGMQPRPDSPGLGLGLSVIHRVARHVRLEDGCPGVRVHMTFAIT